MWVYLVAFILARPSTAEGPLIVNILPSLTKNLNLLNCIICMEYSYLVDCEMVLDMARPFTFTAL